MISEPFDPADAGAWIARGRRPEHAAVIAKAWRHFPDLPAAAAPEDRLARMRQRALALRPVMESMSRAAEEERQTRNFAFTEGRIAKGEGDDRDRAILSARSLYGYDWEQAVRYASGWYAANAGWEPEVRRPGCSTPATLAYDRGFADGGGNRDDLFDTARRAFEAAAPQIEPPVLATGRPCPSEWPKPTDEPLPARWSRRLLLLGAPEAGLVLPSGDAKPDVAVLLPTLQASPGYGEIFVIIISSAGFHAFGNQPPEARPLEAASGDISEPNPRLGRQLRALLACRDFDDVLVAAQASHLALLDAHAGALPLCRTMERTRNTVLHPG